MSDRLQLEKLLAAAHQNFVCLEDLRAGIRAQAWWYGFAAGAASVGCWWAVMEWVMR